MTTSTVHFATALQQSSTTERSLSVDTSISHDNPFSSSAGSHTSKSSAGSSRSLSSPSIQYREIQKGGEIPFSGLRKPAPLSPPPKVEVPKKIPTPVAGYDRAPVPIPRDQRDKLDARRRELLSKLERDERKKKASEEEVERRSRRHSDYFTLNEKSPIAHDRYDRSHVFTVTSAPQSPAHYSTSAQNSPRSVVSECSRLTAVVLYHFSAHHSRELSVLKDDNITIIRRVDANWYEASKDDRRGIIPVSYVQILRGVSVSPSPPERPVSPTLREGTAVAKYNFNPQTNAELALKRGDQVSLIRRIDRNWYEGSLQGSMTAGIFPASYVQVISDPESDSNARSAPAINRSMSAPSGSPRHRTSMGSPLSTRSNNHCSPNRTQLRHGSGVYNPSETSPLQGTAAYGSQLASPTGRTPSSGYGSPDLVYYETRHSNCTNNNNENDSSMRVKPHLPRNGHISEEPDSKECVARPLGGLEMPSYRSLYNYAPHNEDELELNEGDIVHVIEKCADGWFVGTSGRTGMFGTFPGNYVTPV